MGYIGMPFDSLADDLEKLADAIAGEETPAYTGSQDKLRHAVKRLADYYDENPGGGGGLTLYGPYFAQKETDSTILSGLSDDIQLVNILDDSLVYELNSDVPADTKFFLSGFNVQNEITLLAVRMPWYDENDGWTYPAVAYMNNGESSITILAYNTSIQFYASNPLPIKEP